MAWIFYVIIEALLFIIYERSELLLKKFYQTLMEFNHPKDSKVRLILAGICTLIINLIGYMTGIYEINKFGSLGIFTILHYNPTDNQRVMKRLIFTGCFIVIGFTAGMLASLNVWLVPVIISIIGFTSRLLYRIHSINKPGDIFVVLVTAIGTSVQVPFSEMIPLSLYIALGVLLSITMGYVALKIEGVEQQSIKVLTPLSVRIKQNPRAIIDSFFYAITLFFAGYINLALGLGNYAWIVVSCSAILQGNTLSHIINRHFQRIVGTSLGVLSAAFIISFPMNMLAKIILIAIFYVIVEYYIPRNYSIAVFFITNMTMLQGTLLSTNDWQSLLQVRLISIIIGSILGAISAMLQYRIYDYFSKDSIALKSSEIKLEVYDK